MTAPRGPRRVRMKAEDRRELILAAATAVIGAHGYSGTTTDAVAKAAGVSQPYVVRMFGTKEKLFLAVLERATRLFLEAFRAALPGPARGRAQRMGQAYVGLLEQRGLHQCVSHAFLLGAEARIGAAARECFLSVWRFVREEAGMDPAAAREFMANGMLVNTLTALRLVDDYGRDGHVTELFDSCFAGSLPVWQDRLPAVGEPY